MASPYPSSVYQVKDIHYLRLAAKAPLFFILNHTVAIDEIGRGENVRILRTHVTIGIEQYGERVSIVVNKELNSFIFQVLSALLLQAWFLAIMD